MAFRSYISKKFSASVPGRTIIGRSKKTFLPGFHGLSIYEVWKPFMRQLKRTSLVERASGISFNIVMAIPPTLIFIFTLIPYLPISQAFMNELFNLIRDVIPGEKNNAVIINFLKDFVDQPRNELLSLGLLFAIIFSSNAMMGVLRTFDKNYLGFVKRKNLHNRRIAIQLTLIVFFLVFLCVLLLVAQSNVLRWLGVESAFWRNIIHDARWVLIVLLTFYIVSFIYRHGPALSQKWPLITPGSVFATTLMIIATVLVTLYATHFSTYNKFYGSIGAIFILMSLIYANSLALLMGFELNVTLTNLKIEKASPTPLIATKGNHSV
jgi:membrane protein